jgi:hypothetical protein
VINKVLGDLATVVITVIYSTEQPSCEMLTELGDVLTKLGAALTKFGDVLTKLRDMLQLTEDALSV